MDRSSHVYDGIGSTLVKTYTSAASDVSTGGYDCSAYQTIIIHVSVSALVSSGIIDLSIDLSSDNTAFSPMYLWNDADETFKICKMRLTATGDYALVFPACASYFRITAAYVSGTSLTIDVLTVEAKS
ncbi:hypothetical protein M0R72_10840 [Candidatus Pacearchaeota archaeon]|jgi:hypothetical protein|nr:hypothetical protein [Candidatus Pacearchaeota archaeon]